MRSAKHRCVPLLVATHVARFVVCVSLSVYVGYTIEIGKKTAEPIEMPHAERTRAARRNHVLHRSICIQR